MNPRSLIFSLIFAGLLIGGGCKEDKAVPRRTAYPRIEAYPDSAVRIAAGGCSFLINAAVSHDSPKANWVNVSYPRYGATLHLTATPVPNEEDLASVLANRHERMSLNAGDQMLQRLEFRNENGFECELLTAQGGNTPLQFIASDRKTVVSGVVALSGSTSPADSVAPIIKALDSEMITLLKSLRSAD